MVIGTKIFALALSFIILSETEALVASASSCNMERKSDFPYSCSHGHRECRLRTNALVAQSLQSSHFHKHIKI